MSTTLSRSGSTLPWLLRRCAVLLWGALPSAIAAGLIEMAGIAPLALAAVLGQTVLAALATLPPALLLTGSARFAAALVRGDRARLRDALRVDPVLGLLLAAPAAGAILLMGAGGGLRIVGDVLGAALVLGIPFATGYAAVRRRGGLHAWRGGLVLLGYRPAWALTLAALSVIGTFLVIASAGVLGLVVPPYLTLLGTAMCALLLDEIDEQQTR